MRGLVAVDAARWIIMLILVRLRAMRGFQVHWIYGGLLLVQDLAMKGHCTHAVHEVGSLVARHRPNGRPFDCFDSIHTVVVL